VVPLTAPAPALAAVELVRTAGMGCSRGNLGGLSGPPSCGGDGTNVDATTVDFGLDDDITVDVDDITGDVDVVFDDIVDGDVDDIVVVDWTPTTDGFVEAKNGGGGRDDPCCCSVAERCLGR
jgi:hypothetical protein